MKQKIKAFFAARSTRRGGSMAAMTALVLCLFYLLNMILVGFADKYGWYFYTQQQIDVQLSGKTEQLFAEIETGGEKVEILFCDLEENIKDHRQLGDVYKTAKLLEEKHPTLIELSFVNLWLEPNRVEPFRVAEDGEENTISSGTVIVSHGEEFMLNSPAAFYTLDSQNYVTAFNAEEVLAANILWVTEKTHPVAYFTANHGEEIPYALERALAYSGYRVKRLDLSALNRVPEDAGMVVIFAPLYNFSQAAEGAAERAELTLLSEYLAEGGQVMAVLESSYATNMKLPNGAPPHLLSFLAEYGIEVAGGRLTDRQNALPGSGGYSLITSYADSPVGARLSALATTGGRRTILSDAAPLILKESDKAVAQAILYSPGSAIHTDEAGAELGRGQYPLLAMAEMKEGQGRLIVSGTAYLADPLMADGIGYGNKALLAGLVYELGGARTPISIDGVPVNRTAIENLTMGEADLFFALTAVALPCAILLFGLILLRRRKNN